MNNLTSQNGLENQSANFYKLFNYNQFDIDHQNAIRLQQIEAIKLIQISLDKLTSTTSVQLTPNNSNKSNSVLVYKEANLHKNLLVSKILNKAKYIYYQSIIQTMRLSLMSKLNYYSTLIQQLNSNTGSSTSSPPVSDETSIVDEMKLLMQQILHETYQFNLAQPPTLNEPIQQANNPANDYLNLFKINDTTATTVTEPEPVDLNNNNTPNSQTDQIKRIKQLNDVKLSLYSLLFTNTNTNANSHSQTQPLNESNQANCTINTKQSNKRSSHDTDEEDENVSVDDDTEDRLSSISHKKSKKSDIYAEKSALAPVVDLNNNHIVILNDDTNNLRRKQASNNYNSNHHSHVNHGSNKKYKLKTKSSNMSLSSLNTSSSTSNHQISASKLLNIECVV